MAASQSIKMIKTLWGIDDPISPALFKSIAAEGYSGVEVISLAWIHDGGLDLVRSANSAGLSVVLQIHTCGGYLNKNKEYVYCGEYDIKEHKKSLVEQLAQCDVILELVKTGGFVNIHAGMDSWSLDDAVQYLTFALKEEKRYPFKVVFETHRQRLFHDPFQTRDILNHSSIASTDLKLNCDLSHWYVSCERILDIHEPRDAPWWPEILQLVRKRCAYTHCRLGSAQTIQLADPSAPECSADVKMQLDTFTMLWQAQLDRQEEVWSCPEFGPQPYMPSMPHTQEDVSSLSQAVYWTRGKMEQKFKAQCTKYL